MGHFRRLGIEEAGAVEPGAHEFGKNIENLKGNPSVLSSHKMLFVYRIVDLLIWVANITTRETRIPEGPVVPKTSAVIDYVEPLDFSVVRV